jgi:putative transposase
LAWRVKHLHELLLGDVEESSKQILVEIANEHGIPISEMETDKGHIHLLIECRPQHYIPSIAKALKGVSARRMFIKHPELKSRIWGGRLWNPSCFAAAVSDQAEQQLREYIQSQQQKRKSGPRYTAFHQMFLFWSLIIH